MYSNFNRYIRETFIRLLLLTLRVRFGKDKKNVTVKSRTAEKSRDRQQAKMRRSNRRRNDGSWYRLGYSGIKRSSHFVRLFCCSWP